MVTIESNALSPAQQLRLFSESSVEHGSLVKDQGLRSFLQATLEQMPKHDFELNFSKIINFIPPINLPSWKIHRLYEHILMNGTMDFIEDLRVGRRKILFNKQTVLVFAGFVYVLSEKPYDQLGRTPLKNLHNDLREALGDHPLREAIHDPLTDEEKAQRRQARQLSPEQIEILRVEKQKKLQEVAARRLAREQEREEIQREKEARKERLRQTELERKRERSEMLRKNFEAREQREREKQTKEEEARLSGKKWGQAELSRVFAEYIDQGELIVPDDVLDKILFIDSKNRGQTADFSDLSKDRVNLAFRTCIRYLQRYPEIKDLETLYDAVKNST